MPQNRADVEEPLSMPTWTVGRVVVVLVMLAVAGFWGWVWSGAPARDNPDRLDDRAFVERTHERCRALQDDLEDLPNAAYVDDATERADILDDANVLVARMLDDIDDDLPSGSDGEVVEKWLADWRLYLGNRQDYADRLRRDADARLLLDESSLGDSVDRTIEVFADVNDMPDCATPGDVG